MAILDQQSKASFATMTFFPFDPLVATTDVFPKVKVRPCHHVKSCLVPFGNKIGTMLYININHIASCKQSGRSNNQLNWLTASLNWSIQQSTKPVNFFNELVGQQKKLNGGGGNKSKNKLTNRQVDMNVQADQSDLQTVLCHVS